MTKQWIILSWAPRKTGVPSLFTGPGTLSRLAAPRRSANVTYIRVFRRVFNFAPRKRSRGSFRSIGKLLFTRDNRKQARVKKSLA